MDSMTNSERVLHGSLYCLTFVTGLVDAGSYVAMGHVFTANVTGNIVFLGFAVGGVSGLSIGTRCDASSVKMLRAQKAWIAGDGSPVSGVRICFPFLQSM